MKTEIKKAIEFFNSQDLKVKIKSNKKYEISHNIHNDLIVVYTEKDFLKYYNKYVNDIESFYFEERLKGLDK